MIIARIIGAVFLLGAFGCGGGSASTPVPTPEQRAAAQGFVEGWIAVGHVVGYDCAAGDVRINPASWASFDAAFRERVAIAFRVVCDGPSVVAILDARTGRRLAHVGPIGYIVD
jgi:hypothetical protein